MNIVEKKQNKRALISRRFTVGGEKKQKITKKRGKMQKMPKKRKKTKYAKKRKETKNDKKTEKRGKYLKIQNMSKNHIKRYTCREHIYSHDMSIPCTNCELFVSSFRFNRYVLHF